MNLVKAFLIGIVLAAGLLVIPLVIAVMIPILIFAAIVAAVWFILRLIQASDEDDNEGPPDKPP